MSTANKLTYLNVTKQKLKQAINNIGGEVTDETTFREYANQLQGVYDNLPKTEYQEGTEINLGVTSKGKLDYDNGVVGIGQCEQNGTPTPSTPIDIQCVTGNQDVVVSGKNLFEPVLSIDGTNIGVNNSSLTQIVNGEFSFVASGSDLFFGNVKSVGSSYDNSRGIKIYRNGNEKISFYLTNSDFAKNFFNAYDSNNLSLGSIQITSNQGTYSFPSNCEYVTFRFGNGSAVSGTTYKVGVMVAYGDTIPTYEPYITPTSYQLSLGDIELNAIGNYKDELIYDVDEDKVYKNKAINKKIIDGTEGWQDSGITSVAYTNIITDYATSNNIPYCTHFKGENNCNGAGGMQDYGDNSIAFMQVSGSITPRLYIKKIGMTTLQLGTLLAEIKPILYYALETEVKEEITGTLKDQIKALYNAHSNNGTTIITSNGDLPMIIKCRGLKGE